MTKKFYELKQETPLLEKGAILWNGRDTLRNYYSPVNEAWNKGEGDNWEFSIRDYIVEAPCNKAFFARVYRDDFSGKFAKTKDGLKQIIKDRFKK